MAVETQYRPFHRLVGGVLVLLDVSAVGFYVLWSIADNEAVIRAEAHGFDPRQLLANGNWLWLFANATLICLIVLNVILIRGWRRQRRQDRRPLFGPLSRVWAAVVWRGRSKAT